MRTIFLDLFSSITLGVLLVALTGCASSTPSKFYQLSPTRAQTNVTQDEPRQNRVIVAIGPVRIPDYLDRPQIVTRFNRNELKLSEFNRWAGSLDDDIIRVLVDDLSVQLPPDRFFITRRTPYSESQAPVSYRVELFVDRFEGAFGESVLLKSQWGLFGKDAGLLYQREESIVERVDGSSYDALVTAMSNALERLSRDIVVGISTVLKKEQKRE